MDLIEQIGAALGIVAFLALAVLAFVLFQQARDIRRLREWAGRAPERAREAAEASLAAAEARGEGAPGEARSGLRTRLAGIRERLAGTAGPRLTALDRRSPVALKYLLAGVLLVLVVTGALTGGFGLVGDDDGDGKRRNGSGGNRFEVAVLNATTAQGAEGVPQLAARVEEQVVRPAGYKVGAVTNTTSAFSATTVMYAPGHEGDARALATAVAPKLGEAEVDPMTQEIQGLANGAPVALVVGLDDAQFGATG